MSKDRIKRTKYTQYGYKPNNAVRYGDMMPCDRALKRYGKKYQKTKADKAALDHQNWTGNTTNTVHQRKSAPRYTPIMKQY
jgi:hypothetical protein